MKTILLASVLAGGLATAAAAQDASVGAEDQMLLDGTPPTAGAEVPSAPQPTSPDVGVALDPSGDGLKTLGESAEEPPSWVGMKVVDQEGSPLGEIDDELEQGGAVEAVILRRPDGGVETVPVTALTRMDDEVVADRSMMK